MAHSSMKMFIDSLVTCQSPQESVLSPHQAPKSTTPLSQTPKKHGPSLGERRGPRSKEVTPPAHRCSLAHACPRFKALAKTSALWGKSSDCVKENFLQRLANLHHFDLHSIPPDLQQISPICPGQTVKPQRTRCGFRQVKKEFVAQTGYASE